MDEITITLTEDELDIILSALYGETEVHYATKSREQITEIEALRYKLEGQR